ncbi:MAG: hypothetical protein SNF68_07440 [Rikenellaceae bacterium]
MRVRYLAVILIAATLNSCDIYDRVEVEQIDPPQIEFDNILTPDWDKNEEQQWEI